VRLPACVWHRRCRSAKLIWTDDPNPTNEHSGKVKNERSVVSWTGWPRLARGDGRCMMGVVRTTPVSWFGVVRRFFRQVLQFALGG
jgi:hypothetical protein